jgi:tRNA modification GTPase
VVVLQKRDQSLVKMDLETIVAPATAPGRSGVAVIRISGPLALEIGRNLCGEISEPMFLRPCSVKNANKKTIDRGLVVFFKGPVSYTGEDVIEIHCHGNPVIVDLVIKEALLLGARVAEPGEFTKRSFLNDKIDLAQAESVADLIAAQTDSAVLGANASLSGEFSNKINVCIATLVNLRVIVEATIDFPDEETPDEDLLSLIKSVNDQLRFISDLIDGSKQGALMREGVKVVILGAPNVGKSTLLNCFAKENLAIVSDTPGTTRDLISVNVNLGGVPVEFVDTAGLHVGSQDLIEIEGMKRAKAAVKNSDLVLELVDVKDFHNFKRLDGGSLLVFNKKDLLKEAVGEGIFISASNGDGVAELIDEIVRSIGLHPGIEIPALSRRRHILCLENARDHLEESVFLLKDKSSLELVAQCLLSAQTNLGEITNPVSSDDLLGKIFSEFCIGK